MPVRVVFVGAMALNVAFILVTVAFILADKGRPRRWAWALFALFGTWGLALGWSSGVIAPNFLVINETSFRFSPVKILLFGASAVKRGADAPWVLQVGLPLGAILYWWRRGRRRNLRGSDPNPAE